MSRELGNFEGGLLKEELIEAIFSMSDEELEEVVGGLGISIRTILELTGGVGLIAGGVAGGVLIHRLIAAYKDMENKAKLYDSNFFKIKDQLAAAQASLAAYKKLVAQGILPAGHGASAQRFGSA